MHQIAYRAHRGHCNLYPADGALNLPSEKHSHGVRRMCAISRPAAALTTHARRRGALPVSGSLPASCSSSPAAAPLTSSGSTRTESGAPVSPATRSCSPVTGSGVVISPRRAAGRRPASGRRTAPPSSERAYPGARTRAQADGGGRCRLRDRAGPAHGGGHLAANDAEHANARPAPTSKNKWLTASVTHDAATVVAKMFEEASRRDGEHQRPWVALVDGNQHQIDRINAEAKAREVNITVLGRLCACHRMPLEDHMEPAQRRRPRRRAMGPPPALRTSSQAKPPGSPARCDAKPPTPASSPHTGSALIHAPPTSTERAGLPRLPDRAKERLADRNRRDRGRLPPFGQGPPGPHGRPPGDSTAPKAILKLRAIRSNGDFEGILAIPPHPRTTTHPPITLRRRYTSPTPTGVPPEDLHPIHLASSAFCWIAAAERSASKTAGSAGRTS